MIPTPRYVTCVKHDTQLGNIKEYTWDQDKISVNPALTDDVLMLQNVFEAKIISSTIYPLVFEAVCPSIPQITLRSIEFYKEVQKDQTLYQKLSSEEKAHFLIGIRDLFVASCRNLLSEDEKELLKSIVDLIDPFDNDPDVVTKKIVNLDVTPYPTSKNKMVKFIDTSSEDTLLDECFIRNELNLLIGFVDPQDLSYHNFENIVNLNSLFDENFDRFKITNMQKYKNADVFTFDMIDMAGTLKSLDKCGLYTQPLNKVSRGGERFIFSSEILSKNLSESIVKYLKHPKITNKKFRLVNYVFRYNKFKPGDKKFISHYDTPYHDPSRKHHSKYTLLLYLTSGSADPVLSFGDGKAQIKSVDTKGGIKGIIFDQKYEHEGKAYTEGDKIFIRSELIYEYDDEDFTVDNEVSKKFNIGCYMTKQSLFTPEVDKYSSDMFNQAAQARVSIAKNFNTKEILLYKNYNNTDFVTNGYDYWFKKDISLKCAAAFALMDHFNCRLASEDKSFNKLTYQQVIKMDLADINQIFNYLISRSSINGKRKVLTSMEEEIEEGEKGTIHVEENKGAINVEEDEDIVEPGVTKNIKTAPTEFSHSDQLSHQIAQNKKPENSNQVEEEKLPNDQAKADSDDDYDLIVNDGSVCESEEEDFSEALKKKKKKKSSRWNREENCCYKHHYDQFDPFKSQSVKQFKWKLNTIQKGKKNDLKDEFTVMIMDKKMEIRLANIGFDEKNIYFHDTIPGFNFAASAYEYYMEDVREGKSDVCWIYGDYKRSDYVGSKPQNVVLYKNLPSIPYQVSDQGYHLKLELFQNNLIRKDFDTFEKYFIKEVPKDTYGYNYSNDSDNSEIEEEGPQAEEGIQNEAQPQEHNQNQGQSQSQPQTHPQPQPQSQPQPQPQGEIIESTFEEI